ncbi:MAG: DUF6655 family protein [Planctomycetota bacterium]
MSRRKRTAVFSAAVSACVAGCATISTSDTARTAMEQMLVSTAVDKSLERVDFRPFAGRKVFLNTDLLDCVDAKYVIGATRQRMFHAGAELVDSADAADILVDVRSGGVGTDHNESFVGIPELNLPAPIPISIPEIKFWSQSRQTGTAKLGLVAYDKESRRVLGQGGTILARTNDTNTYVVGIGPFKGGSVRDEYREKDKAVPGTPPAPTAIAFDTGSTGSAPWAGETGVRLTGAGRDGAGVVPAGSVTISP